jgi:4-hydroxy-2-oxoheptanedioate aldolase
MGFASAGAPEVEAAIQTVLQECLATNIPCAITTNRRTVQQRLEQGFRFVTVGLDGGLSGNVSEALKLGRDAAGRSAVAEPAEPRNAPY